MCSCAFKGWFFKNGCRCHGNGQNAKKLKKTKMIIKMYYYANKELYIIIINNGGKVICLPNFVWGT
jgi:hypothetical protein